MPAISRDGVFCISVTISSVSTLFGFLRPVKSFLLEFSNQLFELISHDSMFDKAIGGVGIIAMLVFIFLVLFAVERCFRLLLKTGRHWLKARDRPPAEEEEER